jgi:hypothetical protein
VDIGVVLHSPYKYDEHYDDTDSELVDDNDKELEEQAEHPYEEQGSVQEQDVGEDTATEDDDRTPSAITQAPAAIVTQSKFEPAQSTATTSAIMTQFTFPSQPPSLLRI